MTRLIRYANEGFFKGCYAFCESEDHFALSGRASERMHEKRNEIVVPDDFMVYAWTCNWNCPEDISGLGQDGHIINGREMSLVPIWVVKERVKQVLNRRGDGHCGFEYCEVILASDL
jgi:hypothetical protein